MGAKPARPDEEDNAIFHGGEPARSTAIVFRGRLWQTGQEIGISVGDSLTVLEGVVESGEELEAPLDPRIVVGHFADAFERLVIRKHVKPRAPEVASKALDGPDNAANFLVERSQMTLGIEGGAADIRDGLHGAVRLLLFKRSTKTVDARVAVCLDGREPSATASQSRKTKIGGVASSARISRTITFMAGVNSTLIP